MHEFNESLTTIFEFIARLVEIAGIALIVLGLILATGRFLMKQFARSHDAYEDYKQELGRSLLLGLEFLVAADIIFTVAVEQTFESLGILAIVVLIRTFLSWSLEMEVEGHWPWQHKSFEGKQPLQRPNDVA